MMQQYISVKEENQDAILFFRLGDFYEMFFEDALTASKELEIALTKRAAGGGVKVPMCGVPYHVANNYISRLISKGYKVAICDQLEDPALAKGIVKRDITKVITPGTFEDVEYLKDDENNYLLSVFLNGHMLYLSYADYSTGELYTTSRAFFNDEEILNYIADEVYRINPSEILINEVQDDKINRFLNISNFFINRFNDDEIKNLTITDEEKTLLNDELFSDIENLFDNGKVLDKTSLIMLLKYLILTQKHSLNHFNNVNYYERNNTLILDESSKKNLELIKGLNSGKKSGSLLEILDKTKTSMGGRELKKWVESPLNDKKKIMKRLDIIENILTDLMLLDDIRDNLDNIYDIERLSVKISNKNISPKEIYSLMFSLEFVDKIKELLNSKSEDVFKNMADSLDSLSDIQIKIRDILVEDPPAITEEGSRFIKEGYNEELDILFSASDKGSKWLLDFENKEKERTGIKNLRIKYNKILGFFIEISKANTKFAPDDYIRKQTLVGSERYFSMELKEMENKILGSKEKAYIMQLDILNKLKDFLIYNIFRIQKAAREIARLDAILSLAVVSRDNNYTRPQFNEDNIIDIKSGRHPIVEVKVKDEIFVPNDTLMNNGEDMIHVITGPNMAGKSTYMRQVALIVIMAHIGAFVPAENCNISVVDRIFTRIGASDNLAKGDSTFMVEMKEVANIVNNATEKSLLILDEVGRGTSTFDGMSIAWAIVEYISMNIKAKTLFATHYHELTDLSNKYDNVKNLTIEVEKTDDSIIFLRKVVDGFTNNSYGIEVAKLAGINDVIINRADEILSIIEKSEAENLSRKLKKSSIKPKQKSIFDVKKDNFIEKIAEIDINSLSPIDAINMLNLLVKESREI